jgi:hypothetical protein
LAYHVLEIMETIHVASDQGQHQRLASTVSRPAPFPLDMTLGVLDD